MLRSVDKPFDVLLRYQAGVVTRTQAQRLGLQHHAIEHRVATGRWQRIYPATFAAFSGPIPRDAEQWAAVLYAGAGAMLSHQTAAELHRLLDQPVPLIH